MSDKKSAKKKAEVINKKPLIANPTRANQRVSDTEMPEPLKKREMRISSGNETLLKSWIKSKHDQMISFNPIPAYAIENPAQRPYFRGSSLPVCPLRTALDTVRKVPRNETRHLLMDFYTGTGHVIHELLQFWFGVDGSLFGMFQCPECAQLFPKKSTPHDNIGMFGPHVCKGPKSKPHRPTVCKYIEFHINNIPKTGAFDGHCDGVLFVNGKYLVLEIKTTDTAKVRAREKYGPDPKHRVQATAYRYLLPRFLNIPEDQWHDYTLIVYYDRAAPRINAPIAVPYEPEVFHHEIETFVKTRRRIAKGRFDKICGKCKSADDDRYCAYNNICFSSHAQKLIEEILPGYKHISWAPFPKTFVKPETIKADVKRTKPAKPPSKSSRNEEAASTNPWAAPPIAETPVRKSKSGWRGSQQAGASPFSKDGALRKYTFTRKATAEQKQVRKPTKHNSITV
jgi:hypothetical protein